MDAVTARPFVFYEFFAGAGMARAGLGPNWHCLMANDIDAEKGASYAANFGRDHLQVCDVARLTTADLPGRADLAHASPPCVGASLAGGRKGLGPETWAFMRLMADLRAEGRGAKLIMIENVRDMLTSLGGEDFNRICDELTLIGYPFGAIIIDAALFVPQSRERLFIIAVADDVHIPAELLSRRPTPWASMGPFLPPPLVLACDPLPDPLRITPRNPLWWRLPVPLPHNLTLADVLEDDGVVKWDTANATSKVIETMTGRHLAKLDEMKHAGGRLTRSLNYRTRPTIGRTWEIRDDELANCVRTASGGSGTQRLLVVEGDHVRTRRITPREETRLMGLPDDYVLPAALGDGHDLVGDGVVVPVVRHIAQSILEPILATNKEALTMDVHTSGYPRNPGIFISNPIGFSMRCPPSWDAATSRQASMTPPPAWEQSQCAPPRTASKASAPTMSIDSRRSALSNSASVIFSCSRRPVTCGRRS